MASIWDSFYRSYTNKQAVELQKEQFSQQLAVQQATQKLNADQFKFQSETQFPAEQSRWQQTFDTGNTQFTQQHKLARDQLIQNKGYLDIQGEYRNIAKRSAEQQDEMYQYTKSGRLAQAELITALSNPDFNPMVDFPKLTKSLADKGYSQLALSAIPAVQAALQQSILKGSKKQEFGELQPSLLGLAAGWSIGGADLPSKMKFNLSDATQRAKYYGLSEVPFLRMLFQPPSPLRQEEMNPEVKRMQSYSKRLGGFLGRSPSLNAYGQSETNVSDLVHTQWQQLRELELQNLYQQGGQK